MTRVTVAICTWNRAQLLDQTLREMHKLRIPSGVEWELLVVNNNCTDQTDDVIARHADALPIRRLFESRQGQCNARNCAVKAAQGEILFWTDDDVLVDPNWLAEYVKAARQWPDASFFGGTVEPWFAVRPPAWILAHMGRLAGAFAVRQLGSGFPRIESAASLPFGANMAIRKPVFDLLAFDPNLGLCGSKQTRGDETDFLTRLMTLGHYGVWVGPARVRHYIPAERLTAKYIWAFFHGLGQTRVRRKGPLKAKMLFDAPRYAIRKYCKARLTSWLLYPFKGQAWLEASIAAAKARGIIDESRAIARQRSAATVPSVPQIR